MIRKESNEKGKDLLLKEPILILTVMLIMVLVLMLFYRPYLGKAHQASDKRLAADIRNAMMETMGDPEVPAGPEAGEGDGEHPLKLGESFDAAQDSFWKSVYGKLGVRDSRDLDGQLKYDDGEIFYYTDEDRNLMIVVDYASRPDLVMPPG